MQPRPSPAQWSVVSIDDVGIRYGFTTHSLIASDVRDGADDRHDPVDCDPPRSAGGTPVDRVSTTDRLAALARAARSTSSRFRTAGEDPPDQPPERVQAEHPARQRVTDQEGADGSGALRLTTEGIRLAASRRRNRPIRLSRGTSPSAANRTTACGCHPSRSRSPRARSAASSRCHGPWHVRLLEPPAVDVDEAVPHLPASRRGARRSA